MGKRFERLDEAHRKYGKYVRISPRHLSIADPDALQTVYGHGTGTMKPVFCGYIKIPVKMKETEPRVLCQTTLSSA
jgi:phenylalanine-4-hydroxylase